MTNVPAPPIPIHLAEPILARCVHLVAAASLWQPEAIAQPLNVLTRSHVPLVTKAALMQMPEVDLTWATRCGDLALLDFLLHWSKQPMGRPLHYLAQAIVPIALAANRPDVLDWWVDKSGLIVDWDWSNDIVCESFSEQHRMLWLEWWRAQGFPYLQDRLTFPSLIVAVCGAGHVDALDWLLDHVGAHAFRGDDAWESRAMENASQGGHVAVLDWLLAQSQAGVIGRLDCRYALNAALHKPHIAVLEWFQEHAQLVGLEELRHGQQDARYPTWFFELEDPRTFFASMDCVDKVGLVINEQAYTQVALDACTRGDLASLQILQNKGKLVAKQSELLLAAVPSGNLALLDWILGHVDSTETSSSDSNPADLWQAACKSGHVHTLDWLLSNGFTFQQGFVQGTMRTRRQRGPRGDQQARRQEADQDEQRDDAPSEPSVVGKLLHSAVASRCISVLDWLREQDFLHTVTPHDAGECFVVASQKGHIDVLDWLVQHLLVRTLHTTAAQLDGTYLTRALEGATECDRVDVLDWWFAKLAGNVQVPSVAVQSHFLQRAFIRGRRCVVERWLQNAGALMGWFDLGHGRPYLLACQRRWRAEEHVERAAQVATLDAWHQAGQPIDYARCIHKASIHGRIDVLDWLLKVVHAPEDAFAEAWSSSAFPRDDDRGAWWGYDLETHDGSLLWWRANLPHLCTMRVNRGPYFNPIHAHILRYMVHNVQFSLLDPLYASDKGYVSLLMYIKQQVQCGGHSRLQDGWESAMVAASLRGHCHVLTWWKQESGVAIKCPLDVAKGTALMRDRAKQWWSQSGLADAKVLARIKTFD